jgi:hypothetical protein
VTLASDKEPLDRIDRYQNALPRRAGRAEDFGPLTLFVRTDGGTPLHARRRIGTFLEAEPPR